MQAVRWKITKLVVIAGCIVWMPFAEAGSNREGFNFGTSVRVLNGDDRTYASDGNDKQTQTKSDSQAVIPFVGYSFGLFNIGLQATAESRTSEAIETSTSTKQEVRRNTESSLKGASLFARFLFGEVMFMEVGAGLYDQSVKVNNTYTSANGEGIFTGERETYEIKGSGPGYHMGGGIELPMGGNFYFTSAYMVRMIQLRETAGGIVGKKKAY